MTLDPKLVEQLTRDEGKRLMAYRDSRGFWTIGVGHLLGSSKEPRIDGNPRMYEITEAECSALLAWDISIAEKSLYNVFSEDVITGARLAGARWRALVNMMFNRGESAVRNSTTITPAILKAMTKIVDQDIWWDEVAKAILASPWGAQIGARAARLAEQLRTGVDQ